MSIWIIAALAVFGGLFSICCMVLEFKAWRENVKREQRSMRYGYGPLHRD